MKIQLLRQRLRPIFQRYGIRKAILFGSQAREEATRHSDIDLILVQETDKRFFERYDGILYEINKIVASGAVDLLIYTPAELKAISHRKFIKRALEDGKVIYESV